MLQFASHWASLREEIVKANEEGEGHRSKPNRSNPKNRPRLKPPTSMRHNLDQFRRSLKTAFKEQNWSKMVQLRPVQSHLRVKVLSRFVGLLNELFLNSAGFRMRKLSAVKTCKSQVFQAKVETCCIISTYRECKFRQLVYQLPHLLAVYLGTGPHHSWPQKITGLGTCSFYGTIFGAKLNQQVKVGPGGSFYHTETCRFPAKSGFVKAPRKPNKNQTTSNFIKLYEPNPSLRKFNWDFLRTRTLGIASDLRQTFGMASSLLFHATSLCTWTQAISNHHALGVLALHLEMGWHVAWIFFRGHNDLSGSHKTHSWIDGMSKTAAVLRAQPKDWNPCRGRTECPGNRSTPRTAPTCPVLVLSRCVLLMLHVSS